MGHRLDIAQGATDVERANSTQVVLEKLPRDILLNFNLHLPATAPETGRIQLIAPERIAPDARSRACCSTLVSGVTISVVNLEKIPWTQLLRRELCKGCSTPSLGVTTPKTWASRHWEPDSLGRWNGATCQLRDYDGQPTAAPGSRPTAKRLTPSSPTTAGRSWHSPRP